MESYWQSPAYYTVSPMAPNYYQPMSTPSQTYCYCCCSSTPYNHAPISSPVVFSSPSFQPMMTDQLTTPQTAAIVHQPTSKTSARLQYSNRDRYILNELFKRTPYPNGIQRDIIARKLGISQEQIRIWFQNRRRLQTQRDAGERITTSNEMVALQQGRTRVHREEMKELIDTIVKYKNAPPRLRLDDSS